MRGGGPEVCILQLLALGAIVFLCALLNKGENMQGKKITLTSEGAKQAMMCISCRTAQLTELKPKS